MPWVFNPFTSALDSVGGVSAGAFNNTSTAKGIDVTGSALSLHAADASNPGAVSTTTQTFAGNKTFNGTVSVNTIDTPSAGTLALGTLNATSINIGNTGSTVNIFGTVITEQSSTLNVTNPVFTVNVGGAAGSASNSGMQVNENSSITGYVETSADRNSWILKAPNAAGVATVTPGAGGITLNQSSHDPLTLAAVGSTPNANGASISSQILTLQPADGANPGLISTTTQTFAGVKTFTGGINMSSLTASTAVVTDASKNLASLAYSATATASNLVLRNSSANVLANNNVSSAASVTSAAGTTTLTTSSARIQILTGTTTQTFQLPAATSVTVGFTFEFDNNSTGALSVIDGNSGAVVTVQAGGYVVVTCTDNGSVAGVWDKHSLVPSAHTFGTNGLTIGDTTYRNAGLAVKQASGSDHGILLGATDNTSLISLDRESNMFYLGRAGTNYVMGMVTSGSFVDWVSFTPGAGIAESSASPGWPFLVDYASGQNTLSALSNITTNNSSQNLPLVAVRNRNATAGRMAGYITVGSSGNPMSFAGTVHTTQTSASEQSEYVIATQNSGTLTEGLRVKNNQTVQLPAYTTVSSLTSKGILTNDSSGNITAIPNPASAGDINETSFSAANNQSAAANVTGLTFANATVRAAKVLLSVYVNAATPLYEAFELLAIQKGASWSMSSTSVGDASGFVFTITSAGQVQYTNNNYTTFTAATVKFRATTVSI